MPTSCNLIVNGRAVRASLGETLIDAALDGSIVIPQDCRSGQCETCRVKVISGELDDRGSADRDTVLACQATLAGDAEISFEEMPPTLKRAGLIAEISSLSPEVLEVVVALQEPLDYRPGQYIRAKFAGFPAREYSPTCRLDGSFDPNEMVFHVRRLPQGLISSQLGTGIGLGHRVHIQGPFGQAFLRADPGALVLISGGTGWAPIWSLARAARLQQRSREIIVIAGSRDMANLYMRPALDWLIDDGVREVIATSEFNAEGSALPGRPSHYLPLLGFEDTVYVAGPAGLVEAVKRKARSVAARCYADAFVPSAQAPSLLDRVTRALRAGQHPKASAFVASPSGAKI